MIQQNDKQHWNDLQLQQWVLFKEIWGIKNLLRKYSDIL